jgi:surface antigen
MKTVLTKIALVALSASLIAGCASNTQNQNTAVGAVSGGAIGGVAAGVLGGNPVAIGAGVVVGALLGGFIGHNMDNSDQMHVGTALNGKTNRPVKWTNPSTGKSYKVVPTSNWMTINGNPRCRSFKVTSMTSNGQKVMKGTACQVSNGSWQDVR